MQASLETASLPPIVKWQNPGLSGSLRIHCLLRQAFNRPETRRVGKAFLASIFLSGCALARFSETPEGQPVYVLSQPMCVLICAADLGNVRDSAGGSISQSASAAGGGAIAP